MISPSDRNAPNAYVAPQETLTGLLGQSFPAGSAPEGSTIYDTRAKVFVLPFKKVWIGGPDHAQIPLSGRILQGTEGLFSDEFPKIPNSTRRTALRISGRHLYGGPLKNHFGHVMTDSLIRLWAFDPALHDGVVFASATRGMTEPPGYFRQILELFGIERSKVVLITVPSRVERLDFVEPGSRLGMGPAAWYPAELEKVEGRIRALVGQRGSVATEPKIYLGRRHIINKGTVIGESYFAELLEENGFRSVIPERLSMLDQANLLRNAQEIVFAEGSAIYTSELLPRLQANVYMIPRRQHTKFANHLAPKANYRRLGGEDSNTFRFAVRGKTGPSSPSFLRSPERLFDDFVKHKLIVGTFDRERFLRHERDDTIAYFGDDLEQIKKLARLRGHSPVE